MISNADAQDPPTTTTGDNNLNTGKYITNAEENKKKDQKQKSHPKKIRMFYLLPTSYSGSKQFIQYCSLASFFLNNVPSFVEPCYGYGILTYFPFSVPFHIVTNICPWQFIIVISFITCPILTFLLKGTCSQSIHPKILSPFGLELRIRFANDRKFIPIYG